MVEAKAPDGRVLPAGQWKVTVEMVEDQQEIVIKALGSKEPPAFATKGGELLLPNMRPADIPSSGGTGTILFTTTGVLFMGGAATFWLTSRKKKGKYRGRHAAGR